MDYEEKLHAEILCWVKLAIANKEIQRQVQRGGRYMYFNPQQQLLTSLAAPTPSRFCLLLC